MPDTGTRDKAEEQHNSNERRIPKPVAVLIVILLAVCICLAGYFTLSWIFLTD